MGRHKSTYSLHCAFGNKSTKFGTHVDTYILNRSGYCLATDGCGSHFIKWDALAKQIQWKWPESYSEDKLVVIFGKLHIEIAAMKTLGGLAAREWLGARTGASRDYDARDSQLLLASRPRRPHKESSPNHCGSTVHPATPCP